MSMRKAELETELATRETAVAAKEQELAELQKKANMAPKEMETAVSKAVKEVTERLASEGKNREELMKKEFEGERNVLKSKIESLEATVKEQRDQITKLSQQLDKSYQKVEEMAVKALETSSAAQSVAGLQQMITEQGRDSHKINKCNRCGGSTWCDVNGGILPYRRCRAGRPI